VVACLSSLGATLAFGQRDERSDVVVENRCVPALKLDVGWCGDGGPARKALLADPVSLAVLSYGSVAFTDTRSQPCAVCAATE
jgi:hypothetical protein